MEIRLLLSVGVMLMCAHSPAVGQDAPVKTDPRNKIAFVEDVLPILRANCLKCHSAKTRKAELNLENVAGLLAGGESGQPAIVPGNADRSHLFELISSGEMPPGKTRLSAEKIEVIRKWIETSAVIEAKQDRTTLTPELKLARQVHFLMEFKCQPCHGRAKKEGGLDVRTVASMLKGGKSGPALVRGKSTESRLIRRIRDDQMPPRDVRYKLSIKPVTESELRLISKWVDDGAIDPPRPPAVVFDDGHLVTNADRDWWAFRKPVPHAVPSLEKFAGTSADPASVRTPIDAFILKQLGLRGLSFSRPANRRTLIRRATVDLIGLTPSPTDVEAFVNEPAVDAYEQLIERILSSPRYGERWGQHWLDAAGYADSEGSASADPVYPLVYKYRDYVVRSFNSDKPYDRFLLEQLAGDELADYGKVPRMTEELRDNIVATGYLRTCIDPTTSPETNFLYDRYQVLADTVQIVSSSLMGLTMHCARCHSHRYDPLPQRDYYRFTAIFAASYSPYEWLKPRARVVEMAGVEDRKEIVQFNATVNNKIHPINLNITALTKRFQQNFREQKLAELPEAKRESVRKALKTAKDKRTDSQKELAAQFEKDFTADEKTLSKSFPDYKKQLDSLNAKKKQEQRRLKSVEIAHGLTDIRATVDPFYLLQRGEWNRRGRRVLPNVPAVLRAPNERFKVEKPRDKAATSGTRLSFARWLTRPDHPLTARVYVNRVWQHHFGRGIVATADDFGKTGTRPTHPELLDWLAIEFVRRGWSTKALHRLIMNSSVYRQQSRVRPAAANVDSENRLLWRMPLLRMDAEVIRDSMLSIAGQLDGNMFGPAVGVKSNSDGQVVTNDNVEGRRRSIYLLHRRSTPVTVLETFDSPRMTTNCIQRRTSNVVSQALLMMNSQFTDQQAAKMAQRIVTEARHDRKRQIEFAYQLAFSRAPRDDERNLARKFLAKQSAGYGTPRDGFRPTPQITSVIGMHASKGITFDMQAIAAAHEGFELKQFSSVAALGFIPDGAGDATFYVFLDGKFLKSGRLTNNTFETVSTQLARGHRFLTLMTSSNGSMDTDWTFYGDPHVDLINANNNVKTIDLADLVGDGNGFGSGHDHGIDPWTGKIVTGRVGSTNGTTNRATPVPWSAFIDVVFVPNGGKSAEISISTSGLKVTGITAGGGGTYDHIWNGHNTGVNGLRPKSFAQTNGALVDLCLVLLNSAEFLYVD